MGNIATIINRLLESTSQNSRIHKKEEKELFANYKLKTTKHNQQECCNKNKVNPTIMLHMENKSLNIRYFDSPKKTHNGCFSMFPVCHIISIKLMISFKLGFFFFFPSKLVVI